MKMKENGRMEHLERNVAIVSGVIVGFISILTDTFGLAVTVLFGLMALDMLTGILVGLFNYNFDLKKGVRGIVKKCMILLLILALSLLSQAVEIDIGIASGAATAFAVMEFISIADNATKVDIVFPKRIRDFIQSLMGGEK